MWLCIDLEGFSFFIILICLKWFNLPGVLYCCWENPKHTHPYVCTVYIGNLSMIIIILTSCAVFSVLYIVSQKQFNKQISCRTACFFCSYWEMKVMDYKRVLFCVLQFQRAWIERTFLKRECIHIFPSKEPNKWVTVLL